LRIAFLHSPETDFLDVVQRPVKDARSRLPFGDLGIVPVPLSAE
jgi:hypothetical protein